MILVLFRKLSLMALLSVPLWAQTASSQANLTAVAGTNQFSVPTNLIFTASVTGSSQVVNGSWSGGFLLNETSGRNPGWDLSLRANSEFSGSVVGSGLARPTIAGVRVDGSAVSFTGLGLPPSVRNNVFPLTTSDQVLYRAHPALGEGVGRFTFGNPTASLNLPFNVAAGSWTTQVVFTASNL